MSFQQGLSGLNAAARNLDVIGNNVANANTVGAKSARAEFADIYANSLGGGSGNAVGIGATVATVAQQFTQGDISTTNNPLDIAINGAGFFETSDNGAISFTRNGQFKLDSTGHVVNAQGARLQGFMADSTGTLTQVATDLQMKVDGIAPSATTTSALQLNLDARATVPTNPFSLTDPTTYSGVTSMTVYSPQGQDHTVSLYFRKTAANAWEANASMDGTAFAGNPVGTLTFDTSGALTSPLTPVSLSVPVDPTEGGPLTVGLDLTKLTQFSSQFAVLSMSQDGYGAGSLAGFSIGADGTISARYSNGRTMTQGQVTLVNFRNPQGLAPLGGNAWSETAASGAPLTPQAAGTGNLGSLQSGAVEQSNVDLTAELVNMITAQRVYQANAQTVKAQDTLMQTIVNLR